MTAIQTWACGTPALHRRGTCACAGIHWNDTATAELAEDSRQMAAAVLAASETDCVHPLAAARDRAAAALLAYDRQEAVGGFNFTQGAWFGANAGRLAEALRNVLGAIDA